MPKILKKNNQWYKQNIDGFEIPYGKVLLPKDEYYNYFIES